MERPYVVCHMLASVDGKIDGTYMNAPECTEALREYGSLRSDYKCQAALYGTVTMEGGYSPGSAPEDLKMDTVYPREDYAADSDVNNYIVSLDPKGTLGWESKYIEKKNRPRAHVIEVLTGQVTDAYVAYLREFDISYVFAGDTEIDCVLLLEKLKKLFHIDRLMIAGGGYTNWSFLQAGCIDELSLVIAPLADGSTTSVSIFEKADFLSGKGPVALSLKGMKKTDGGAVWLCYTVKGQAGGAV